MPYPIRAVATVWIFQAYWPNACQTQAPQAPQAPQAMLSALRGTLASP